MAFTYGFYNSVDHDRVYDAIEVSSIFDGIVEDGIFNTIGEALRVKASSGMKVVVGTGRAWFHHSWSLNTSDLPLTISAANATYPRIDAVVLEVDSRTSSRKNRIFVKAGTPATNPVRPTMTRSSAEQSINQYALAYITVPAKATSISQGNITSVRGTSETPYSYGALNTVDAEQIYEQWDDQFGTWFDSVKETLDGDTAGKLLNMINNRIPFEAFVQVNTDTDFNALIPTENGKINFTWELVNSTKNANQPLKNTGASYFVVSVKTTQGAMQFAWLSNNDTRPRMWMRRANSSLQFDNWVEFITTKPFIPVTNVNFNTLIPDHSDGIQYWRNHINDTTVNYNAPLSNVAKNWIVMAISSFDNTKYVTQVAIWTDSVPLTRIFVRSKYSTTWSYWSEITNTKVANDYNIENVKNYNQVQTSNSSSSSLTTASNKHLYYLNSVSTSNSDNSGYQVALSVEDNPTLWFRVRKWWDDKWSNWVGIEGYSESYAQKASGMPQIVGYEGVNATNGNLLTKYDKEVNLIINCKINNASSAYYTEKIVWNIPEGFRPKKNVSKNIIMYFNNQVIFTYLTIYINGEVKIGSYPNVPVRELDNLPVIRESISYVCA